MNIFAYDINGQTLGVDIDTWNTSELSGNTPFITSESETLSGYTNITSIENWDEFGDMVDYRHYRVRDEIKNIYDTQTGTTWSAYTTEEKIVLSEHFIVDKDKRDSVLTDEEQEEHNHYKIYHHISDDVIERFNLVNSFTTPKSIDYKKDLNQRLHPEYTFDNYGWLISVTYYETLVVTVNEYGFHVFTYSEPILNYVADYTIGLDGYVKSRIVTRKWVLMDGTFSDDSKVSVKIYEPLSSRAEGVRRRKNLINRLLIDSIGLFIITTPELSTVIEAEEHAVPFMHSIEADLSAYYESGAKEDSSGNACALIQNIAINTYTILDNYVPNTGDTLKIRDYIISRLNPQ